MDLDRDLFRQLVLTLLDFQRRPGRYAVLNRNPRLLFDNLYTILLLASGKEVLLLKEMRPGPKREVRARRAARYFVRTVLLRPGASPELLLGLPETFDARTVREHYRLMMRMTHPDMHAASAATPPSWPADAAQRINLAHQVLSSAARGHTPDREAAGALNVNRPRMIGTGLGAPPAPLDLPDAGPWSRWRAWQQQWQASPPLVRATTIGAAAAVGLTGLVVWAPFDNAASLQVRPSALADRPSLKVAQKMSIQEAVVSTAQPPSGSSIANEETLVLMTNLITGLHSGRGQHLMEWVDPSYRTAPHNQDFVERIDQLTGGRPVRRVQTLSMTATPIGEALQVTAVVEVELEDAELTSVRRSLRINAHFERSNQHAALVRVSAIPR
ncbi:J domain-containing protein [Hydrogenophaga sp. 5NK40-0174]|uniref:J domain-containing protein n=1 Tax=Hydrogenophaga sp. 5NK40-0174 TaxID=3127649 RepID=UPI0031043D9E